MRRLLPLGLSVTLTACNLAPAYERPTAPVPPAWPNGSAYSAALPTEKAALP